MSTDPTPTDPRIDDYIAKAAPFAQPILAHMRALVHAALPGAEETIKWSMPHFTVGGRNVAGIAAFKAHCAFVIHGDGRQGDAMGQYGKIATLADLPPGDELAQKLREAAARAAAGPAPRTKKEPKPPVAMPPEFAAALSGAAGAQGYYDGFAPGQQREYLEWITDAKTQATRDKRIAQAVEWIAEGKKRNWKYEKC